MIREPVARRYAHALFDSASVHGLLDTVASDLAGLVRLLRDEPRLSSVLVSPQVTTAEKRQLLTAVLGGRAHALVLELLWLLLEKKRLPVIHQIIEGYQELLEAHRNIVRAEVTTAVPLPAQQEQRLKAALERRTGKTIMLQRKVDPRIVGGVMVRMGDQVIDRSIRRVFQEMKASLLEVPVAG
jgi:F-type H+-transporting ATPase subunit delta